MPRGINQCIGWYCLVRSNSFEMCAHSVSDGTAFIREKMYCWLSEMNVKGTMIQAFQNIPALTTMANTSCACSFAC